MMGEEAPETCWAKHIRQVINLWNCCIFLVNLFEKHILSAKVAYRIQRPSLLTSLINTLIAVGNRDSSDSTVTSRIREGCTGNCLRYSARARHAPGPTQLPRQWVVGDGSQGLKRPRHEADHIPPSSALVKNEWSYCTLTGSSSENFPQTVQPRWSDSSVSAPEQYVYIWHF